MGEPRKYMITTTEPMTTITSNGSITTQGYSHETVICEEMDMIDGLLMFYNIVKEPDEGGFLANHKRVIAAYSLRNIVGFKLVKEEPDVKTTL